MDYHVPVLLSESIDALKIKPNGTYVDLTFGGAGHSKVILEKISTGRLFAFDADVDSMRNIISDARFTFYNDNYRFFRNYLLNNGVVEVDGILADLGVSSYQIDDLEKGFSYRFEDSDLDMRMDKSIKLKASDILNSYDEYKLASIFFKYGELNNSNKLARLIVKNRVTRRILTVRDLKDALSEALPLHNDYKILSKLFQALRIEVNGELDSLKEMLLQANLILKPEGRLVVISYHSLEDKIVKDFIKTGNFEGKIETDFYGNQSSPFNIISKKPIDASKEEIERNIRARSAKMRIAEKK